MSPAVVLVGDVGSRDGHLHVGDEAMTEAAISELARRGATVAALVSAEPRESASRYGVPTLARLGFDDMTTPTRAARERRLAEVTAAALDPNVLDPADPARAIIESISVADGLIVAGGGNLSSVWPEHVYERSALVAIASALGKPIVISGQTLGPALTARDGELLSRMLGRAALVGVRETLSYGIAQSLGASSGVLRLTRDDAIWLEGEPFEGALPDTYCVVTVAPYTGLVDREPFVSAIAELLDRVVVATGLDMVFLPHEGTVGAGVASGDQVMHQDIIDAMTSNRVLALGVEYPRTVAAITRGAALSISTRYHPAVFASAVGVPTVGMSVDDYTAVKIGGALALVGLEQLHTASSMLASGQAETVVLAAWAARDAIGRHVAALDRSLREESGRWWDDVVRVLAGHEASPGTSVTVETLELLPEELALAQQRMLSWQTQAARRLMVANLAQFDDDEHPRPTTTIVDLERRLGAAEAALADSEQRVVHAQVALESARSLVAEIAEPMFEKRLGDARIAAPVSELEALLSTRTFRWTAGARRTYARVRGLAGRARRRLRL